ncbi:prepilin-type N-terminal cleavage/methylation domain-containing protein [Paenibacillus wulumuqiensis]|uniref:prepilin-type N-terminal cleavage/methylation domain-containing protein n=1 Tax=Paenibacillus wulumuqiensis TaxID=1567107 RepID=UPI0006975531|nr:prepilin-type N-terminal cleavage/methylation domain-containing protein [Paenibacillus wulumuqiensis]
MLSKVMKKMGKEEKGFTLIELLAVIVILAIIAVIAVPLIGNILSKSRDNADLNTASQIYNAARMYVIGEKNGDFKTASTITLKDLKPSTGKNGYIDSDLYLPSTKLALNETSTKVEFNTDGSLKEVVLKGGDAAEITFTATEVLSAVKKK